MRKALSILIALTIIIGMIPTAFASTTEEPYAKTYEFTREALTGTSSGKNFLSLVTSYDSYKDGETTYTKNHDWKFFGYTGDIVEKENLNNRVGSVHIKSSNGINMKLGMNDVGTSTFALSLEPIDIEKKGFYRPKLTWRNLNNKVDFRWYMSELVGDGYTEEYLSSGTIMSEISTDDSQKVRDFDSPKVIYASGNKDIITVFRLTDNDYAFVSITLTKILDEVFTVSVDNDSLDLSENKKTTISAKVSGTTDGTDATKVEMPIAGSFVTYKTSPAGVVTIANNGTVTAVGSGTATVWAETSDGTKSNEITVTVTAPAGPEEDTEIADAFTVTEDKTTITSYNVGTVSAVAYTLGTDEQDSSVSATAQNNGNGTYTLNASEAEGYKFLYWKKGVTTKKDVITYEPTGFVYAPTAGEKNIVIAVYEKIGEQAANKAEFYNANGQFIEATDGSFPEDIPSLVGYGDATGWKCYTDGKTYGLSDSVTPNGTMLFVADYKDTPDIVDVTVNKGYGDNHTATVGTKITCNPVTAPEGQVFRYWTKTNVNGKTEIVSIDETYTFYAYETCTVTANFADVNKYEYNGNIRKIILDTFTTGSATALMAEFIGFKNDNVVEKGIMLDNNRIAMKSTGTQFTIIPDEKGTYMGYAIVKNDDNSFSLITDGEYKVQ